MPNVMIALPNIGRWRPLLNATKFGWWCPVHCSSAVQYLCQYRRTQDLDAKWIFHLSKFHYGTTVSKSVYSVQPRDGQTSCKVWLISVERRRCSNEAKTRNPFEICWDAKLTNRSQPLVGLRSPYCENMCRRYCCITRIFPIVDICLSCEDIARQIVRWCPDGDFLRNFCVLYFSEPRAGHFRHVF